MTQVEAAQVLSILKAAYPNSFRGMKDDDAAATVAVWAMQFAEVPVDIVIMAVHKAVATNVFPPSVAEVKAKLQALHWEAWMMLYSMNLAPLEGAERERLKRVVDSTDDRGAGRKEPTLAEFMEERVQIGGAGAITDGRREDDADI